MKNAEVIDEFVMYGFNYEHNFIDNVWEGDLAKHLKGKFNGDLFRFYTMLSDNNQRMLVNYIMNKIK